MRAGGAATINVGLGSVERFVRANRRDTNTARTDMARAIEPGRALLADCAQRTVGRHAATVNVGLTLIDNGIIAGSRNACSVDTMNAFAIGWHTACLASRTRIADGATTVSIRLAAIEDDVRTSGLGARFVRARFRCTIGIGRTGFRDVALWTGITTTIDVGFRTVFHTIGTVLGRGLTQPIYANMANAVAI